MISKLLNIDVDIRLTAQEALNHPWIKSKVVESIDAKATSEALINLTSFRVRLLLNITDTSYRQSRSSSKQL